jgi:hypothetical protein
LACSISLVLLGLSLLVYNYNYCFSCAKQFILQALHAFLAHFTIAKTGGWARISQTDNNTGANALDDRHHNHRKIWLNPSKFLVYHAGRKISTAGTAKVLLKFHCVTSPLLSLCALCIWRSFYTLVSEQVFYRELIITQKHNL